MTMPSLPDSSPAEIICTTFPGRRRCWERGLATFSPCWTASWTDRHIAWKTVLPDTSAVMPSVSSMGTPALTSSPIVCIPREMYMARRSLENSGSLRAMRSHRALPQGCLRA